MKLNKENKNEMLNAISRVQKSLILLKFHLEKPKPNLFEIENLFDYEIEEALTDFFDAKAGIEIEIEEAVVNAK